MICKYTPVSRELDYRLSKWILKNIEQLLEPDEITGRAGNAGTLTGKTIPARIRSSMRRPGSGMSKK